jgi:hypothetical protein
MLGLGEVASLWGSITGFRLGGMPGWRCPTGRQPAGFSSFASSGYKAPDASGYDNIVGTHRHPKAQRLATRPDQPEMEITDTVVLPSLVTNAFELSGEKATSFGLGPTAMLAII